MKIASNIIDLRSSNDTEDIILGKSNFVDLAGIGDTKKPYKRRLSFIESTGTQYIDTGVATANTIITEATIKYPDDVDFASSTVFGSGTTASNSGDRYQIVFSTETNFSCRCDGGTANLPGDIREVHTVKLDAVAKKAYIDGKVHNLSYNRTLNTNNIFIFVRKMDDMSTAVPTKMLFYGCNMWDDETQIREFIPVIDWNDVVCLYDMITKTFFYNAGTGDFVAGV